MKTPRAWLLGGAALTLVCVTATAAAVVYLADPPVRELTTTEPLPFGPGPVAVRGTGTYAELTVLVGDVAEASLTTRLRWTRVEPVTSRSAHDGVLLLETQCDVVDPYPLDNHCGVDYTLRVPARTALSVTWHEGTVAVDGPQEALSVRADSGPVTVYRARSAAVDVFCMWGPVTVGFATPPRDVRVNTASGHIRIDVPGGGYRIDAVARGGTATVRAPHDPDAAATISAHAEDGDVSIA